MSSYSKISSNSPLRTISLCRGDNALFSVPHSLPRAMSKKKVPKKKLANLRLDRLRPSTVPPRFTFLKTCGALSDSSSPKIQKPLKLCSRKGSVNLTVAWCEPDPHHAHCAPRAVWAQTALVRGNSPLRTNFILYRRERSDR